MPGEWSVRTEGADELGIYLELVAKRAEDMTVPLQQTADYISAIILFQFDSEGTFRSGGWMPLAEKYEAWKLFHNGGEQILQLEPWLLHSSPGTPEHSKMIDTLISPAAWDVSDREAVYEPDSTRAAWHQTGAYRSKGGYLPARPVLDLNEEDYAFIDGIFEDWLDGIL